METHIRDITVEDIRKWLKEVVDPEIPVISIEDLGVLRDIRKEGETFIITITPTYSGCPAMDMITLNIHKKMRECGVPHFKVETQIAPPWTTDWMSEEGKRKLKEFGIAPPMGNRGSEDLINRHPPCPFCNSTNTVLVSAFGSTACKALFKCKDCAEPFDYFKCH
ncbi:MAG: phenylacetate-CoA oxygenase subunit PaaJ [Chitinophagaceae bacterium]|nr:phenylacetate-CoA oxygenase subunit PaaJ [Chitinophagaceae bacterium]